MAMKIIVVSIKLIPTVIGAYRLTGSLQTVEVPLKAFLRMSHSMQ